jgi:hypothetical protein
MIEKDGRLVSKLLFMRDEQGTTCLVLVDYQHRTWEINANVA